MMKKLDHNASSSQKWMDKKNDLLEKYNEIWDKVSNIAGSVFDTQPVF